MVIDIELRLVRNYYEVTFFVQQIMKKMRNIILRFLLHIFLYFFNNSSVVKTAMMQTLVFCTTFLAMSQFTISIWAIFPFLEPEMRLPLAAWFPFSTDNKYIFTLVYIYQIFGISMSACFNCSTDSFSSAIIAHANAQVQRLGIQLSKVGVSFINQQTIIIN